MSLTYTQFRDLVETVLQDSSNATWPAATLDDYIKDGLREVAQYKPYVKIETLNIESRKGSATATTAGALVDTNADQFLSTDTNKVVYNVKDRTWAIVTAYVDETQLTLSKDIFTQGEGYEIYNRNCLSNKELYIGDVPPYLWIDKIIYKTKKDPEEYRNFEKIDDRLILLLPFEPDNSAVTGADTEVFIHFAKRHFISQLTDLAGAVDLTAGYVAGSTSMVIDAITTDEVIEVGQEFTVAGIRGKYTVTTQVTIAGNEATVSFYPGLESAAVDDDVVTFRLSTLDDEIERIFAHYIAGYAAMNRAVYYINRVNKGGSKVWSGMRDWGERKMTWAINKLEDRRTADVPWIDLP